MKRALVQAAWMFGLAVGSCLFISCSPASAEPNKADNPVIDGTGIATSAANTEFLMTIPGSDGGGEQSPGAIDVTSFSWGIENVVAPVGSGGGAGRATFHDYTIQKKVDKSSPALMMSCASGSHIPEVKVIARKKGGRQQN